MSRHAPFTQAALALALLAATGGAYAADVTAASPDAVAVTVYRSPARESGGIRLDSLGGFALLSEQRRVDLPAGDNRLSFEGVADGIDAATAIVTGLPGAVLEKNRDAALLTPATLLRSSVGKTLTLVRTNRKTGKSTYSQGVVRAATDASAVFESADGIEALGCSGLTQAFSYGATTGLSSSPTLSVLVRTSTPVSTKVTLSYLSRGFDWAADYVAQLTPDGRFVDLGAWVTLANSNGVGFPAAQVQVVAGRVNREDHLTPDMPSEPAQLVAECWPQGSTSDAPVHPDHDAADRRMLFKGGMNEVIVTAARRTAMDMAAPAPMAQAVLQEELGDLKLYRVPEATTLASRQAKQVRLLDRARVPVTVVYELDAPADMQVSQRPSQRVIRTKNTEANHLGLPIPSGHVTTFVADGGRRVLIGESGIRDTAVDEDLEIPIADSNDVQVSSTIERLTAGPDTKIRIRGAPGYRSDLEFVNRVDVVSARREATAFELRLVLDSNNRIVGADRPFRVRNGRSVFDLTVPAGGKVTVRYQTNRTRYESRAR